LCAFASPLSLFRSFTVCLAWTLCDSNWVPMRYPPSLLFVWIFLFSRHSRSPKKYQAPNNYSRRPRIICWRPFIHYYDLASRNRDSIRDVLMRYVVCRLTRLIPLCFRALWLSRFDTLWGGRGYLSFTYGKVGNVDCLVVFFLVSAIQIAASFPALSCVFLRPPSYRCLPLFPSHAVFLTLLLRGCGTCCDR
jgi:hypothetical protein